jgi:hypothetical protein
MTDTTPCSTLHASSSTLLASSRWGIYLLLIAVAVGNMTGRLLNVNSVDRIQLETARVREALERKRARLIEEGLTEQEIVARLSADEAVVRQQLRQQRPFLSANDRSRWLTIRSLVELGTYEIDRLHVEPTWDTIDMVQHEGQDGKLHRYSSKPPLLATLLAGEYWLINRVTGFTLRDNPYEIGRAMLFTINVLPMILMFVIVAGLAERFGTTDWGRIFVVAAATLGTFLNTFAVVLNNHTIGAACAAVALYAAVRIAYDGERRWRYFLLAGFAAALTAADELPALTFLGLIGLLLLWNAPKQTLFAFVPAMLVVVAAFFATNWIAHHDLKPPYMHRSQGDDWYSYEYKVGDRTIKSYWLDRKGIDRGEESKLTYAVHVLVGHHGVFSLTPVWLLSIVGALIWLWSPDNARRQLAAGTLLITIILLVFYIGLRPQHDRNYGGMTSGFRWMFWCAPLWLVVMLPAVDRLSRSITGMAFASLLLTFSVLSASYPTWNPWIHPWIYTWMQSTGWKGL